MARRYRSSASAQALEPPRETVVSLAFEPVPRGKAKSTDRAWQRDGWRFYDLHGEVHYPLIVAGNLAGRVDLVVQERAPDGTWRPTRNKEARKARDQVESLGMDEFWRSLITNTAVAGDGYLLVGGGDLSFELASTDEVRTEADGSMVRVDETGAKEPLDSSWRVTRFYRPHPRYRRSPDSGLRSVLNECRELELLKLALLAKITSRLASVGILFLPNSISMPGSNDPANPSDDPTIAKLTELFTVPLRSPGAAAAAMPILLRGPDDAGEKIRHIILDTSLDDVEERHRAELRRAIANGIELPIETQTSIADTNHWQAWHVSESALHDHLLPLCRAGANLLSVRVLHPWLRLRGEENPARYRFWVDGSRAALGLNRADLARQMFDRGGLSLEALRSAHGFDESHAPSAAEVVRWLGVKLNNPLMATWDLPVVLPDEVLSGPTPPGMGGFDAAEPQVDAGQLPGDPSVGLDRS